MLPSSHAVPISTVDPALLSNPQLLADAFSEFISASSQLEASYRGLQQKVAYLSGELADRNKALTRSLAENDRIRKTLQQMIDSLPCGVLVVDNSEAVVIINPEGRRLLGIESVRVEDLNDIARASRIDFEALAECQSNRQDTEVCLAIGIRGALGGHRPA